MAPTEIVTILGESRPISQVYADGSFDCPWCYSAVIAPEVRCHNPACDTNPRMTAEMLKAIRAKQRAEVERRKQTEANMAWAKQYRAVSELAESNWRQEQIEEAKRRGACLRCLFQPGYQRVKFIKHRGECPKVKGR